MPKEHLAPFYFLEKTVNALLVDDDPGILSMLVETVAPLRLYNINTATSTRKAQPFLEPGGRIHMCVLDLGLADVRDDEFYLLKSYSKLVPFVVLTGALSAGKGFAAGQLGAKDVIQKGPGFDLFGFVKRMNHLTLLHIINPRYRPEAKDSLNQSTKVLFEKSPEFVTDWAVEMGITDRELRYIWKRNLGANAKIILFIYQVYRRAFDYYEKNLLDTRPSGRGADELPRYHADDYRRMEEYYHLHRSTICDYLAYGNVVNIL